MDRAVRAAVEVGRVDDLGDRADRASPRAASRRAPPPRPRGSAAGRRRSGGRASCSRRGIKPVRRTRPRPGDVRVPRAGGSAACRQNRTHVPIISTGLRTRLSTDPQRPQRDVVPTDESRSVRRVRAARPQRAVRLSVWTRLRKDGGGLHGPRAWLRLLGSALGVGARRARARRLPLGRRRRAVAPRARRPPRRASSSSASASSVARTASSWARSAASASAALGRLDRGELLLGRQLATLGHDERLHLGGDALEHVHRDR